MFTQTAVALLIERIACFRSLGAWRAVLVALLTAVLLGGLPGRALAGSETKISRDLRNAVTASSAPPLSWVKVVNGVRYVKVLVVSSSSDPDLVALRADILAKGGAVYMRYVSIAAVSAMLPADRVVDIALRSDVQIVSPNRLTARTYSSDLELTTGTAAVRSTVGLDGSGIGVAVLDSGIGYTHKNFLDATGKSRVKRAVDFQKAGDATSLGVKDWTPGIDVSASLYPGSRTMGTYESKVANETEAFRDRYGHGSHVASVAAGRENLECLCTGGVGSSGMAPGALLYDVKVLSSEGYGQLSDALAGIDWVIYHAKEYNIRVLNLSLAADSTDSYLTDPLARAARSAVAAGITVVVAGGNFGRAANGAEQYGSISSPGNEPSVITVGSSNGRGTLQRADDVVNNFSSRGPTRGGDIDSLGVRRADNVMKPDLVAPGNRIVGALATDKNGGTNGWNLLAIKHLELPLVSQAWYSNAVREHMAWAQELPPLMYLSGTSIAAPTVSGTVALMLQANPGLTPPLIKAILQYTAQALPGANVLQQGAGMLNVEGAVRMAQALRTDVASAVQAGTISAGASLLAPGKTLPEPYSWINGETVPWSRVVFAGGDQVLTGTALFTKYQPIYDPRLTWVRSRVSRRYVAYWPAASGVPANTYPKSITESAAPGQVLITSGVASLTRVAGVSSLSARTGLFMPLSLLSDAAASGSGITLSQGIVLAEGIVLCEGIVLAEGLVLSEGIVLAEGIVLSEGIVLAEGIVLSETGQIGVVSDRDGSLLGEP